MHARIEEKSQPYLRGRSRRWGDTLGGRRARCRTHPPTPPRRCTPEAGRSGRAHSRGAGCIRCSCDPGSPCDICHGQKDSTPSSFPAKLLCFMEVKSFLLTCNHPACRRTHTQGDSPACKWPWSNRCPATPNHSCTRTTCCRSRGGTLAMEHSSAETKVFLWSKTTNHFRKLYFTWQAWP